MAKIFVDAHCESMNGMELKDDKKQAIIVPRRFQNITAMKVGQKYDRSTKLYYQIYKNDAC